MRSIMFRISPYVRCKVVAYTNISSTGVHISYHFKNLKAISTLIYPAQLLLLHTLLLLHDRQLLESI